MNAKFLKSIGAAVLALCFSAYAYAATPVACVGSRPPVLPLGSHRVASLAKLDALAPAATGVIAVRSGDWSDPGTWGGAAPVGRVVIPSGVSVVFDETRSRQLQSLRIEGCLEFSNAGDTRLDVEFIYVAPGGELLAGTKTTAMPSNVTTQIIFRDTGPLDPIVDPTLVGKGLVAASRVRIYGSEKTSRVKTSTPPLSGDTVIQLQQTPAGWAPGDRVVLTGVRFIPQKVRNKKVVASPSQDEIRFVLAINGSSVTLDKPLAFNHIPADPSLAPYLVNYSRNFRMVTERGSSLPFSQRAHSMYMSPETTIRGVEFYQMGRTNKKLRSVDASTLTSPTATSNVKGRYPLHLHQPGFVADAFAPVVQNVAVWNSPGWGITHHNGKAFLFQNNTFNTAGAGFVSESGNETGAWVENTAIRATGVNTIPKAGADVSAFDLGRTGDGFWLQSRSVRLHKNLAVGMTGGAGFIYFHRNNDLGSRFPLLPNYVDKNLCMSASMRYRAQAIDKPNIAQFTDNEVFASKEGFRITKPSPLEPHDIRSVLDNFTAWEVKTGVALTYTARYTIKGGMLIGARFEEGTTGVIFGKNTYDLAVVGTKIRKFDYGVNLQKSSTRIFAPDIKYTVAGAQFSHIGVRNYVNRSAGDQILSSIPPTQPAALSFPWSLGPKNLGTGNTLKINGSKSDSSGITQYPVATDEFILNGPNFARLAAERGWYTVKKTSQRALVIPEFYSDRITGEIFQTSIIVTPSTGFNLPDTLLSGASAYQGKIFPAFAPPTANDDFASVAAGGSVTILPMANDITNDGALFEAGYTPARNGNVYQFSSGNFEYTPYPGFTGVDQFNYWVRNRQGFVQKATITVTVF